jgi:hypothetical protein
MVEGSLAVSVTDFAVLYVPPTGEAVTVGAVVSIVSGNKFDLLYQLQRT